MVAPATLFWLGVSGAAVAAAAGGALVVREYRRKKPIELSLIPGAIPPIDLGSGPMPPPIDVGTRVTPSKPVTLEKEKNGTINALVDGPPIVIGDPYEGTTRLRPTRHVFSLFELPRNIGTFEISACVSLDYDFTEHQEVPGPFGGLPINAEHDYFTWARILKWEDGKRVRLFADSHIELYESVTIRGTFDRFGRISNVSYSQAGKTGLCRGNAPFPRDPGFMYLHRMGSESTIVSWGAFTWDGNLPEGSPGSDKYRPRYRVFVEDGWLKMRIWVSPMPTLHELRENQAWVEAKETPYHYAYDATLRYGG